MGSLRAFYIYVCKCLCIKDLCTLKVLKMISRTPIFFYLCTLVPNCPTTSKYRACKDLSGAERFAYPYLTCRSGDIGLETQIMPTKLLETGYLKRLKP